MTRHLSIAALAAVLSLASPVFAQDAIVEGPGHELSEGTVLHPSAGFELGVVSNVFYEATKRVVAPVARLLLDLAIANDEGAKDPPLLSENDEADAAKPTPPKLQFRGGLRLTREQYFSDRTSVKNQSDFGVGAHLKLKAYPQGTVAFKLQEKFAREIRPTNFESTGDVNRDINHLQLGMVYQPGGRAMTAGLRYENTIDIFEGSDFADRIQHLLGLRADWQFLPITKFYFDGSIGFFGGLGSSSDKNSSMPLRLLVGAASAITEMTTVRFHIGYGNAFYEAGPSFANVLFGGEFGLRYSPFGRFTLAYQYDFKDSINANFYRDHAVIAKLDQQLGLVLLGAGLEGRLRGYRGVNPIHIAGPASRDDLILSFRGTGQYLYRDWLAITGEAVAGTVQSDYRYDTGSGTDDPSYSRFEVWLGTRAAF